MMNLSKMTLREQVLVLVVTIIIVGGIYGWLRFYPANKAIGDIKKNIEMMEVALKTGKIPEEPFDDVNTLKSELKNLEIELNEAMELMANVNKRLSPPDTTAVRLAISDAARNSLVRIINNEEYRVTLPAPAGTTPSAKTTVQPQKRQGDAAQRRARNERRASRLAGAALTVNQVSLEQAMPLARIMAINGPMERPMQRVVVEGTFAGMMRFIESLKALDMMVTVVQLQLVPTPQAPPTGYNQGLSATMVLAL
jgi:hypothetical protein